MSGRLQAVVEQGLDLPPKLPVLVVRRGHVDEELVLQQHVDVPRLQAAPAALRPPRGLAELCRQVVEHGALVSPLRLHLDGEAGEVAGETCHLHLREGEVEISASVFRKVQKRGRTWYSSVPLSWRWKTADPTPPVFPGVSASPLDITL